MTNHDLAKWLMEFPEMPITIYATPEKLDDIPRLITFTAMQHSEMLIFPSSETSKLPFHVSY